MYINTISEDFYTFYEDENASILSNGGVCGACGGGVCGVCGCFI